MEKIESAVKTALAADERKAEQQQIAETIVEQLGGKRFQVMTGVHNFTFLEANNGRSGGVRFKVPKGSGVKCNTVTIELNWKDLYDLRFETITTRTNKVTKETKTTTTLIGREEDVFCEQLEEMFTHHTGLYTRF